MLQNIALSSSRQKAALKSEKLADKALATQFKIDLDQDIKCQNEQKIKTFRRTRDLFMFNKQTADSKAFEKKQSKDFDKIACADYKYLLDAQELERKQKSQEVNDHVMNVLNRTDGFSSYRGLGVESCVHQKRGNVSNLIQKRSGCDNYKQLQEDIEKEADKNHMKILRLKAIKEQRTEKYIEKIKKSARLQNTKDLVAQILEKRNMANIKKNDRNHQKSLNLTSLNQERRVTNPQEFSFYH
ncbi:unnamed protein product [Moneuplotes crassus]|uniref:Uncharacterized protein n=1 Tax=Euplotes crassus TaxID=5936 RepID=A0AAD1U0V6_EUPCR|nr:unnamed protein product [Moneuplotes crassus]